ncbi:MAG TPA: VTT domain-containing protein, partial [Flavisolibacter sp.]
FQEHAQYALILSLVISIVVAILGVIPSVFITAANILFFGFWQGTIISFAGEALGAVTAFILYRKGFRKKVSFQLHKFPRVAKLVEAENTKAFFLILVLRLIPYVPSGLVTFAASVGRVSTIVFGVASSLGKIPALILEALSVKGVTLMFDV